MMENFIVKIARKLFSEVSKSGFQLGDLGTKTNAFRSLPVIIVSVTTRCNFNCPHCLREIVDEDKALIRDLPVFAFETILKEGKKINFQIISFTGGEPILHPNFKDLVFLVNKYGYTFNFASNGWLYKEYWDIIKEVRRSAREAILSLDGVTSEVHDGVRNKKGSFERLLEAIKFYRSQEFPVMTTFCVTKKNYHQIEKLPDFCLSLGVRFIKWVTVISVKDESHNFSEGHALTDEERLKALQKIFELRKKYKNKCAFWITPSFFPSRKFFEAGMDNNGGINFCKVLNGQNFYVDHDGGILPCCDINKECRNKPLVLEKGFEKSMKINLDVVNEIKKKFMAELLNNSRKLNRICDFCNDNIEQCLDLVNRRYDDSFCG